MGFSPTRFTASKIIELNKWKISNCYVRLEGGKESDYSEDVMYPVGPHLGFENNSFSDSDIWRQPHVGIIGILPARMRI